MVSKRLNDETWASWPTRALLAIMAVVVALGALPLGTAAPISDVAAQEPAGGEEVIVVLEDGADPVAAARDLGVEVTHIYRYVFTGFSGIMLEAADTPEGARSSRVVGTIFPDGDVQAERQTIPDGVRRSGVPVAPGGENLAVASPIDADIAILDTGIRILPDLTVAGGISCVGRDQEDWDDDDGHGTHISGITAAIDNEVGVVGVAPGARLWAVKVLDQNGNGSFSDVICGLDWVVANKDIIDVINLSLSGEAKDKDRNCESTAFHRAICAVVDAGIPVVVAAGNQGTDAKTRVPARYNEVITVSGISDSDGEPGRDGPKPCFGSRDDVFLPFSNYGHDVDIAAPGDCILSYARDGDLKKVSGTSEAAPHVAGATAHFIADYEAANGSRPTPEQVRMWLLTEASRSQAEDGVTGDPDAKEKKKNKKDKKKKDKKNGKKGKRRNNKRNNKDQSEQVRAAGNLEPVLWLETLAGSP